MLAPGYVLRVVAPATPDVTPIFLGSSYAFIEAIYEQDPATSAGWRSRRDPRRGHHHPLEVLVEANPSARIISLVLEVVHSVQEGAPPPAPPPGRRRAIVIVMG